MTTFNVEAIDLAQVQLRQSAKYRLYPADVIPAWVAEMDFPIAEPIARALHDAIDRSDTGYRSGEGLAESVRDFAAETWGWDFPTSRVVLVPDVLVGAAESIRLLTAPGDGVVITTPVYHPFFSTIRDITERQVVEVPLLRDASGSYALDLDGLAAAFASPEVTAFLLCSPHNPTGTVPTADELRRIAGLAEEFGVAVIADEIHAPLTMPGVVHTPYLSVVAPDATAVSLISASKAWNLAGLKCAQMVGTETTSVLIEERMPKEVTYGTGHLGAIASVAAYREGREWLDHVMEILDGNRRLLSELLATQVPDAGYVPPDASYLAWIDLSAYGWGDEPGGRILSKARVALSEGTMFGSGGEGHVRLNMATSPGILREIVHRIGRLATYT